MLTGEGIYPEGSHVIKSKLKTVDDETPELFTVMQKMALGYDEANGNWKSTVFDGETLRPIASGRIDSCINCHENYAETDYITRTYFGESVETKP